MDNLPENVSKRIKDTFIDLLREKTYKRITCKEIAAQSGMTRQNLYYYYKSKEAILEDIIEEFFDQLYDTLMLEGDFKRNPDEELGKAVIRLTVDALKQNQEIASILFSRDINTIFINKQVAFLKRMLGAAIRVQNIHVNDPKYIHYLALQIAGATYLPLREWLVVDHDFPSERIVELAYPMLEQVIQTLKQN